MAFQAPQSPINLPMGKLSRDSINADKALVYDPEREMYTMLSPEVAKLKVMREKPRGWKIVGAKVLAVVGVCALILALLGAVSYLVGLRVLLDLPGPARQDEVATPTASPAVAAPTQPTSPAVERAAATPVAPVAPAPATKAQATVTAPAATPAAAAAATQASKPPTPPATAKPTPKVAAQAAKPEPKAAPPAAKPAIAAAPASAQAVSRSAASSPVAARAAGGFMVSVEPDGVMYFDGTTTKLYRIGERLPTGQKVIVVDPGSATYVLDDNTVRQIRSQQMKP